MVLIRIGYHTCPERLESGQRGLDIFVDWRIGENVEQAVDVVFEGNASAEFL